MPVAAATLVPTLPPATQTIAISRQYATSNADAVVCAVTPDFFNRTSWTAANTKRSNRTPFVANIVTKAILKYGAPALAFAANNPREIGSKNRYKPKTQKIASSAPIVLKKVLDHHDIPVDDFTSLKIGLTSRLHSKPQAATSTTVNGMLTSLRKGAPGCRKG